MPTRQTMRKWAREGTEKAACPQMRINELSSDETGCRWYQMPLEPNAA